MPNWQACRGVRILRRRDRPSKRAYEPQIARAREAGLFVDIVRPFTAGRARRESGEPAAEHLARLLARTGARSAILSVSDRAQLDAVLIAP